MSGDAALTIIGTADVAAALGVSSAAVSNHLARHDTTPAPDYRTPDGRLFWNAATGVARWKQWYQATVAS